MQLRDWQVECIQSALNKYKSNLKHFLVLATPGAGKTIMASSLAKQLLDHGLIDLVLCFSPSSIVSIDFSNTLETIVGERFDGTLGARGRSLTYQSMQFLDDEFWQLLDKFRIFVIFDEIHHCAGSCIESANSWGEQIILNIQDKAQFTLALTGTPWRSDMAPITLSQYCDNSNKIQCDYIYGLADAINDHVCRKPHIFAFDNDQIAITQAKKTMTFNSLDALLCQSALPYQKVLHNEKVIAYIFQQAQLKLNCLRQMTKDAAGLIVASSVAHAHQIQRVIALLFDEVATVITYHEDSPTSLIQKFRNSTSKWVISVGMISEGTNIPRLQVCCHLTHIKTEMHFRQILGRILRRTSSANQSGYFFMLAEPKLMEYAYRVADDIPAEADIITFTKIKTDREINGIPINSSLENTSDSDIEKTLFIEALSSNNIDITYSANNKSALTESYEKIIDVFGKFKKQTIEFEPL